VSLKATLIYSPRFLQWDMGAGHPMKPIRLQHTYDLIEAYGLLARPDVAAQKPPFARESDIKMVHADDYVEAVKTLSAGGEVEDPYVYGLGTADCPIFPGMYDAAALAVGGTMQAASIVADYRTDVAFNIAGGLHHAHEKEAAGFCYFNDAAIAIAAVLRRTQRRVRIAYVDIDVHHGDGVEEAFYNTPDVLTISVHETGRYLFPGTGVVAEPGLGPGKGYSVNVPLSPYTDDDQYVGVFEQVVMPLLGAYQPDYLFTQLGADTHFADPLAHINLTIQGYERVVRLLSQVPAKWIAMGGGGYNREVVPRAWTVAFAIMCGVQLSDEIPASQADKYPESQGRLYDPEPPYVEPRLHEAARRFNDATVEEIKELIFPVHGL